MADVNDQVRILLRVRHFEFKAVAREVPGIANLTTGLGVERRAIEYNLHRLVVPDLRELI